MDFVLSGMGCLWEVLSNEIIGYNFIVFFLDLVGVGGLDWGRFLEMEEFEFFLERYIRVS